MLNFNSVMIGTKQAPAMVAFYEKVLGKPADMSDAENGFHGWQVGSAYFSILRKCLKSHDLAKRRIINRTIAI